MIPELWERKFEIDSVANVLRFITEYYFTTGDVTHLDNSFYSAINVVIDLLES